ncbi:hypothetical protein [Mucilaginibacter myungsuensis]|uniref:Uncharacterized protein n=1 Tax=Mucilaginibacter myungsuensis TaxID=649104 RepID=A0A929KYA4_9SPHI|nr:hypothetical protein [Mucilaginibacter myungsuensis]MBE9662683.1 hypothetical protein [Mucilaginibacter myungsuensis]MDN3598103.1 hypothetical protein [Mucilaginibacter myungsuensis]
MDHKTKLLFACLMLLCLAGADVFAQKLPNVQKTSVYAPAGIKIDGKTTEWNNTFQANNSATAISYTMANDEENLYLAIQATDGSIINKVLNGGIRIKVIGANKAGQPVKLSAMLVKPIGHINVSQKLKDKGADTDSLINALSTQVNNGIKDLYLTGVKDIADTTLSVFNEYGVKQAIKFDINRAMNVEIAIPLKYISHLIIADNFKYNLMLPGINMGGIVKMNVNGVQTDVSTLIGMPGLSPNFQSMFTPTDFSGNYNLAKK